MLSIGKLVGGAEDYYLRTVASGREEYYTGAGEAPGRWTGAGAEGLGLSGLVGASQLRVLLAGFAPDGERISFRPPGSARVAGFDLTFSAPKSVSVLWALSDPDTSTAIRQAHDAAVADAFGYLERHATRARRGAGGIERIGAEGLVGASFRHRTSRSGDPQLHSHVLVVNAVRAADGRWSAPDARLLYFHARTAGSLYQASLRAGLVASLGVSFGPVEKGSAEIAGVDEALLRAFSSRRRAIEASLERRGLASRRAAEVAALETRPAKASASEPALSPVTLQDRWRAQATELGVEPAALRDVLGQCRIPHQEVGQLLTTEHVLGPDGLTAQRSTFERRDVVRTVADAMAEGAAVAAVEAVADRLIGRQDVIRLEALGFGGGPLHTTAEMLAVEEGLLRDAARRRHQGAAVVAPELTGAVVSARPWLSEEQAAVVGRLTGSGHGLEALVGKAGSGKTQALEAARAAWEAAGARVSGTALSARAAAELQARTAIPADTVAALLQRLERGQELLSHGDVLVVDEAAMVGTRTLARLATAAGNAGAKLVLVGDHRQLPEIEVGGAFAGLAGLGALALHANRRQHETWERRALDELRAGDVAAGLEEYRRRGRVHLAGDLASARSAMVRDWLAAPTREAALMLASRRVDVEELNRLARTELRRRGGLGPDVLEAGGRAFALGDAVLCLHNDRGLRVRNGTRGMLVAVEADMLTVRTDDGARRLPLTYVAEGWLAHGYATTIHKAQGATTDRSFVLAGGSLYREAGYVAMSRARVRTDLYVPEAVYGSGIGRGDAGVLDEFERTLAESRAKRLASSYPQSVPAGDADGHELVDPRQRGLGLSR